MSVIEASWMIVVLYQPSDDVIQFWLEMAKRHHLIVVDNSPDHALEPDALGQAKHVYHNHNNGGIAGALNYGLRWLSKAHPTQQWCFLFDQDSRPSWDFLRKWNSNAQTQPIRAWRYAHRSILKPICKKYLT